MVVTVTGAASSGKSCAAENIAVKLGGRKGYFAAMKPFGAEGALRIERHRRQREGKGFRTVECWHDFDGISFDAFDTVLLECVPNLLANAFFEEGFKDWRITAARVEKAVKSVKNTVIVTGDVFSECCGCGGDINAYIEALGRINFRLAEISGVVIESVAGIPFYLKGGPLYE